MLWTIIVILVILWLLGFFGRNINPGFPQTGGWIPARAPRHHMSESRLDGALHQLGDPRLLKRKMSTKEPASARDISSRSPTMRWKRLSGFAQQLQRTLRAAGQLFPVRPRVPPSATAGWSGERSSWLTSEFERAPHARSLRSCSWSTIALNERVKPSRSGSAASGRPHASRSPAAMAPAASETTASSHNEQAVAGEAAQCDAENGGDAAGCEEGEQASTRSVWSRSDRSKTSK